MQHISFLFKTNGGVIENADIYDERDYFNLFLFFSSKPIPLSLRKRDQLGCDRIVFGDSFTSVSSSS